MRTSMRPEYGNTPRGGGGSRSTFNLSESHKTTFNANHLIPFYWDYVYPGEIRKSTTNLFVRMSNPLEFPLMDNLYVSVHWFDVSLRILWDNFRKFYGERDPDPDSSIDFTIPELGVGNADLTTGSTFGMLCDYLGLPHVASFDQADASALPFRAYNAIYDYWYRDQQIQDSVTTPTDDGPDAGATDFNLLLRGKRFDYFTNVLPAPQRGDSMTIGGSVATAPNSGFNVGVYSDAASEFRLLDSDAANVDVSAGTSNAEAYKLYPNTTIHELRNAVSLQQFFEKDNRHGTRFGEQIWSHWGTEFQDARYAPVYLAGGRSAINITPILNAAKPNVLDTSNLGELGAIGAGAFSGASFTYAATEPSILMGIMSVDGDMTYHQGLKRQFSYRTRFDFMYPEFEGIGDQALLQKELFYTNTGADEGVFGYSPRYEECRIGINKLSGEFRPDNALSLDTWHVAQDFVGAPALNTAFIKSAVPMGRVLQSTINNHFICDMFTKMSSTKQLSMTGIPGLTRL